MKAKPSNEDLLELYALFKQGNIGDVNTGDLSVFTQNKQQFQWVFYVADRPGLLDVKGKAKWDAWNAKKGTSKDTAKEQYIAKAEALINSIGLK